ncbi:MAG TPA: cytochrome c3 family protein [Armatimonadota bacterium]|nr:cytochrome c3 family protein [Armatimonadota bacterium]
MKGFSSLALLSWLAAGYGSADNADCLMCHSAKSLHKTIHGQKVSLYIDSQAFQGSVHGAKACVDCHTDLKGQPLAHKPDLAPVQCAQCHKLAHPDTSHRSVGLNQGRPRCQDCHGSHYIRPEEDPRSNMQPASSEPMCTQCHSEARVFDPYRRSVHGAAREWNGARVAACIHCHPVHTAYVADSPIVCGTCHAKEFEAYAQSSHGSAPPGDTAVPTCVTCHGGHGIRAVEDLRSPTSPAKSPMLCAKCHDDPELMGPYRLPTDRMKTYRASYHGIENKYGNMKAATCVSCHNAHRVLPASDPDSSVNAANLRETCGKCHPETGPNVIKGSIHLEPSPKKDAGVYWVGAAYRIFVTVMILAFCGYMALDLFTHRRTRRGGRS